MSDPQYIVMDDPAADDEFTDEQRQKVSEWYERAFNQKRLDHGMILLYTPIRLEKEE